MLRISSLSPISLFHSYTPLPHPTPTSLFLSSSANMSLPRSPPLLLALYNSLSVSLKMFQSPYHSFQSLHLPFFQSLFPKLSCSTLCVHMCERIPLHLKSTFALCPLMVSNQQLKKKRKYLWHVDMYVLGTPQILAVCSVG